LSPSLSGLALGSEYVAPDGAGRFHRFWFYTDDAPTELGSVKGYEYDDANQLTGITQTNAWRSEFAYDALGRRRITRDYTWSGAAWTLTNEVRYVWDGMCVFEERDGANVAQVTYTRGHAGGFHQDGHGH
jgi:YD repeat-containing protein